MVVLTAMAVVTVAATSMARGVAVEKSFVVSQVDDALAPPVTTHLVITVMLNLFVVAVY